MKSLNLKMFIADKMTWEDVIHWQDQKSNLRTSCPVIFLLIQKKSSISDCYWTQVRPLATRKPMIERQVLTDTKEGLFKLLTFWKMADFCLKGHLPLFRTVEGFYRYARRSRTKERGVSHVCDSWGLASGRTWPGVQFVPWWLSRTQS